VHGLVLLVSEMMRHVEERCSPSKEPCPCYATGAITQDRLLFEEPICLYASDSNVGAMDVAEALHEKLLNHWATFKTGRRSSNIGPAGRASQRPEPLQLEMSSESPTTALQCVQQQHHGATKKPTVRFQQLLCRKRRLPTLLRESRISAMQKAHMATTDQLEQASHVLLLLNRETFTGSPRSTRELTKEMLTAVRSRLPILVLHDKDSFPFAHFLDCTPRELITHGVYKKVAIDLHPEPFFLISALQFAKTALASKKSSTGIDAMIARMSSARVRNSSRG